MSLSGIPVRSETAPPFFVVEPFPAADCAGAGKKIIFPPDTCIAWPTERC